MIESVVCRFISRGFFDNEEKMDVVQHINEQMLKSKLDRIKQHFNGSVYLTTYFSKVVYNACLELARSRKNKPHILGEETLVHHDSNQRSASDNMAIQDELRRFEGLLRSLGKKRRKVELSLKLMARVVLTDSDLKPYLSSDTKSDWQNASKILYHPYDKMTDKEVFALVIPLFNAEEGKNNTPDSVRRWIQMQMDRMVLLLNGNPPTAAHSRDSVLALVQLRDR